MDHNSILLPVNREWTREGDGLLQGVIRGGVPKVDMGKEQTKKKASWKGKLMEKFGPGPQKSSYCFVLSHAFLARHTYFDARTGDGMRIWILDMG